MSWTRAVGATFLKTTDPNASPKQIEVVVKLPTQWAYYSGNLIPQLKQLPPLESLKGIYRFDLFEDGTNKLVWCFSSDGKKSPDEFVVSAGSQRTLVTLRRYDQAKTNLHWAKSIVPENLLSVLD